jgi:acyl carrier protein
MLEIQMDLEADLGIDSIKRVEIIGAMQELFSELPKLSPEELAEQRTLGKIAEYLGTQIAVAKKKCLAAA